MFAPKGKSALGRQNSTNSVGSSSKEPKGKSGLRRQSSTTSVASSAKESVDGSSDEEMDGWEEQLASLSASMVPSSRIDVPEKTIYFVRHAQSLANVHKAQAKKMNPLGFIRLCYVGFDAHLSPSGQQELLEVRSTCQALLSELDAIMVSTRKRTLETAKVLFGGEVDGGFEDCTQIPLLKLDALVEMKLDEHIQEQFSGSKDAQTWRKGVTTSAMFRERIERFLRFAWDCRFVRFVVVGHSRWFRSLLGIANPTCDVHKVEKSVTTASLWRLTLCPPADSESLPRISCYERLSKPKGKHRDKTVEKTENT